MRSANVLAIARSHHSQLDKPPASKTPKSGRILELLTNQPGVQFYSGNLLDGTVTGKYGRVHRRHDALCLEPQRYPDTPNRPDFPSARLDPAQTYRHTSLYRFSTS